MRQAESLCVHGAPPTSSGPLGASSAGAVLSDVLSQMGLIDRGDDVHDPGQGANEHD